MALGKIVLGMPEKDYHAHPAVSRSALAEIARSPFHYHAQYLSPNRPAPKETESFKMGTLAHCAILEPAAISQRYAMRPPHIPADKRTTLWKDWHAKQLPHLIEVSEADFLATIHMENSLRQIPTFESCMEDGRSETTIFWTNDEFGIDLKIRPDWIHECGDGSVIILDLKTTSDASPTGFAKSVVNFGYHRQAAFYSDVYAMATGRRVHDFIFAVVESTYPYAAACYTLSQAAFRKGRQLYHEELQLLSYCQKMDDWPAFGTNVQVLELPRWATKEDDE